MTTVAELAVRVCDGDRVALGQAITLIESTRSEDRLRARALLAELAPKAGGSHRIGVTGAPGVGKSSLIEALGKHLTVSGHRVGVLAVDPSSTRSGGSILGDKTRMQELSRDPNAFIRPSPSRGELGGVARRTRETMSVLEAAGYDVLLVETVGVGQSEATVANMVDTFLVLQLAGGGDALQGIKRGILELVDVLAVTKADGDNETAARHAQADYAAALPLMTPRSVAWTTPVLTCSAVTGSGVAELWSSLEAHRTALESAGEWERRRGAQRKSSMWDLLETALVDALRSDARVAARLPDLEVKVEAGELAPDLAAEELLAVFRGSKTAVE